MEVCRSIASIKLPASACAIGMFDGVHVGHVMVLENALREARLMGIPSVVVSFANHPQTLISRTPTQLLSALEERLAVFEQLGFDYALILDFDEWLKNLPADEFIQLILRQHLGVRSVTVGYDHRFGKNRAGDGEMLKAAGAQAGFDVQIIDPVRISDGGQIVSSTLIRKLLAFGDIEQANTLLGHPYSLTGLVEQGLQRGRQLGFPTANLTIDPHRLIPANGTYGGLAVLDHRTYYAVCNIGLSPTFGDQLQKRVEVHLLGYEGGEFYGRPLQMQFLHKIRDELKFPSVDALVQQIRQDCHTVQIKLAACPPIA
jgi:riboflavin kinase/FMN adenylyltransferase